MWLISTVTFTRSMYHYRRDWLLSAISYIRIAIQWGHIIQDVLMKQVMIKVCVVSSFARQQQRGVAGFGGRSSHVSIRIQQ